MLKKTIKYTDYNGVERTEDFYFNLTKAEVTELEISEKGRMSNMLKQLVTTNDEKKIVEIFKSIIVKSYGVKSVDGKRFIKNPEVLDDFMQSEAYSELFMEMAQDASKAEVFMNGIIPAVK